MSDNLSEWPYSIRHKDCPYTSCCDFYDIYVKLSNFSLHGFEKMAVLILNDSKSEGWEKNCKH